MINHEDSDVFVYLHSTKWFNLQSPEGRESALWHILALTRWQTEQDALVLDDLHDSSEEGASDIPMDDD